MSSKWWEREEFYGYCSIEEFFFGKTKNGQIFQSEHWTAEEHGPQRPGFAPERTEVEAEIEESSLPSAEETVRAFETVAAGA